MEKITYASLATLGEDFHRDFELALRHEQKRLGQSHPLYIGGAARKSKAGTFDDLNPAKPDMVLGKFQSGTREHARAAIGAGKEAFRDWSELGWPQRVAFLRKAAGLITRHQFELAALLTLEVGKNRFEAIAEVSEAADLILYYCKQIETQQGYERMMGGTGLEQTRSILRPYGVWVVISPFNFPLALPAGMAAGALLGGNTVVFKPASDTPYTGLRLYDMLHQAGLPIGVFNFLTGPSSELGSELTSNPQVDGLVFTGSREVGFDLRQRFSQERLRPCIAEMGGKNPSLIMPSANLDDAAEGVVRSAFGMGGQKCSACSRVYVHEKIKQPFLELLVQKTQALRVGNPVERETFLGPLINEAAVGKYDRAVRLAKKEGRILCGGAPVKGESGYFVEPTIVDKAPTTSLLFREEFFAPILAVAAVKSLDEAILLSNDSEYGLTAGIFTREEHEREKFFAEIEAGVTYCNRRGGATTGAWPGVQSFGGWKNSGSTGKNALGPYYVAQFMREQSRTVIQ